MAVGLDADTDWGNRTTNIGDVGIANWTMAGWHYRDGTGLTRTEVVSAQIMGVSHGSNGRHVSLKFDNRFNDGSKEDPYLFIEDNGGTVATFAAGDQPPFDTWVFFILRSGASGGTIVAEWTDDDGDTWQTASGTNTTEGTVQGEQVLIGRGKVADANTSYGYYAYFEAFSSDLGETTSRDLIYKDATESDEWAFWPLADNTDTGDDSGNARTMTFNGTFTSETSPTVPSQGASGTNQIIIVPTGPALS